MVAAVARLLTAADKAVSRQLAELRGDHSGCVAEPLSLREIGDRFLAYLASSRAYVPASLRKYAASVDAYCRIAGEGEVERSISAWEKWWEEHKAGYGIRP